MVIGMPVRAGAGLATHLDPRQAAIEAAVSARAGLGGERADLVVVFAAGDYLAAPDALLEGIHEALAPVALIGCGASGVLGGDRELEGETGVSVWAASLGEGVAQSFSAIVAEVDDGVAVGGIPDLAGASGAILLPDGTRFPTDPMLRELAMAAPGVPILGGVASGGGPDGGATLFHDTSVLEVGAAVGVRLDGVELVPCVSQGAMPLGPELTITASDGVLVQELAGAPALSKLRDVIAALPADHQHQLSEGLLLGVVKDLGKPEFERGDFLVRPLMGADPEAGTIAVGTPVAPGDIVRLHVRDADVADEDLRDALSLRMRALGDDGPAGALAFTCNGRGRGMFGIADHDAQTLTDELDGVPVAGFFAAGEIGPLNGESVLHGLTATVAIFGA
jgi:small ligand-binding sensory domain FIST